MNKKILLTVLALLLVGGGVLGFVALRDAGIGASDITKNPGCKPRNMPVRVSGLVVIKDKNLLTLEPNPVISSLSIGEITQNYLGFFKTDYVLKILVVQDGIVLGQSGAIESTIWNDPIRRFVDDKYPFEVDFRIPDNNCDDRVDPFRASVVARLDPDDRPSQQVEKFIQVLDNGEVRVS